MPESIPEITKKFLDGKSLEEFAQGLGIECSRQMVWYWKEGRQNPSLGTLFGVRNSPSAEKWARKWAEECLVAMDIFYPEVSQPEG